MISTGGSSQERVHRLTATSKPLACPKILTGIQTFNEKEESDHVHVHEVLLVNQIKTPSAPGRRGDGSDPVGCSWLRFSGSITLWWVV